MFAAATTTFFNQRGVITTVLKFSQFIAVNKVVEIHVGKNEAQLGAPKVPSCRMGPVTLEELATGFLTCQSKRLVVEAGEIDMNELVIMGLGIDCKMRSFCKLSG